jgi:hypothetical protein
MSKAQATGEGVAIFALIAVVSTRGLMLRSGWESTEGPIVHRECTGNAETTFGHFDAIEVQSPMGTAALRAGRAELQELPERKLRGIERE